VFSWGAKFPASEMKEQKVIYSLRACVMSFFGTWFLC